MAKGLRIRRGCSGVLAALLAASLGAGAQAAKGKDKAPAPAALTEAQVEEIVRRSYPYVALYLVNNRFATDPAHPNYTGGWNRVRVNTRAYDHESTGVFRPTNDLVYVVAALDLRAEPVVMDIPDVDSAYASLEATAYDHYVNVPLSTAYGREDFRKPQRILFYSARTQGFRPGTIEGVDRSLEMTGDFVSVVVRALAHTADPERMKKIAGQLGEIQLRSLAAVQNRPPKPGEAPVLPPLGRSEADVFGTNLPAVMQFVMNHTTWNPADSLDQAVLAAWKPLGIAPGGSVGRAEKVVYDGELFRRVSLETARREVGKAAAGPDLMNRYTARMFLPKGSILPEVLLYQSVVGPLGQPMHQAVLLSLQTADGSPLTAAADRVVRMKKEDLPPARAAWSLAVYDQATGAFLPNERRKYEAGTSAGMRLDKKGGVEIHLAAKKPRGVPEENWIPVPRSDAALECVLRLYAPDPDTYKDWRPPVVGSGKRSQRIK